MTSFNIVEVYLQEERYNARVRATIPSTWIAVLDNGDEFPICRGHEASSPDEALAKYK